MTVPLQPLQRKRGDKAFAYSPTLLQKALGQSKLLHKLYRFPVFLSSDGFDNTGSEQQSFVGVY